MDPTPSSGQVGSSSARRVTFPPTWHAVIFGLVIVGLAVLVIATQEALAPYIVGAILVFLMNGTVDRLEVAGVPRWAGTLIAIAALIVAIVLFVWLILDAVLEQLGELVANLPAIAAAIGDWLAGLGLPDRVYAGLEAWIDSLAAAAPEFINGLFGVFLGSVASIAAFIVAVAGLPFWIFYTLSDSPKLMRGLHEAVPSGFRSAVFTIIGILGDVFGAWARGVALIAVIVGIPFFIGFTLFGIWIDPDIGDYALLFAIVLAISELIPVIGPILALIPILLITAVVAGPPGVVAVLILFVVIEQVDGAVIQPKIQGHELDLHPAIILPALVVGSALAGLMGAILALPLAAAARQSVAYLLAITDGAHRVSGGEPAETGATPSGP